MIELPRNPGETNWQWCQRMADMIPPEDIVRGLIKWIALKKKYNKRAFGGCPTWSVIGDITNHGSGVATAITLKYGGPEDD